MNLGSTTSPQRFFNGEVHDWYRIVLGYSDHLVSKLLDQFALQSSDTVLDPFCGAGTTLVECMKRGITAVGIDANPSSCFAARVKTNWDITSRRLLELLRKVEENYWSVIDEPLTGDPTYRYLATTGMLKRGWICPRPLQQALAIKLSIQSLRTHNDYRHALMLALISEVVKAGANVRFGPELYCGPKRKNVELLDSFRKKVRAMAADLNLTGCVEAGKAFVFQGDSRRCDEVVSKEWLQTFSAVICSPPYPAEHDYTRNSRLELSFLEAVADRESLQAIKREMIRSHTKGIYKEDNDRSHLTGVEALDSIIHRISVKAAKKSHGFARLYTTVVQEYFGGMKRHLVSVLPLLKPGAHCAYVVGDQGCYLQVHIPTAEILSHIVSEAGFENIRIERWRERWSTTTSRMIDENILLFQKPSR